MRQELLNAIETIKNMLERIPSKGILEEFEERDTRLRNRLDKVEQTILSINSRTLNTLSDISKYNGLIQDKLVSLYLLENELIKSIEE